MPTKQTSSKQSSRKNASPKWAIWVSIAVIVVLAVVIYFSSRNLLKTSSLPVSTPTVDIPADISVADADYLYQNNSAYFLDVRPTRDWTLYHIENSISIPLDQLSANLGKLPKVGVIIVVDELGDTSPQARDALKKAGFTTVTSMTGGLDAWVQAGYPFIGTAPY